MLRLLLAIALLTPSPALAETITGSPKIVDGDTLDIGSTTIRLHGIDAPEVAQPGGRDATNALARLVERKTLTCEGSTRDDHRRLIAKCWIGNNDINAAMVRAGYAWAFVKYSRDYASLEQTARRELRGIWRKASEPPWDYRAKRWHVEQQTSPNGCPIKGNITRHGERIYHAPWSPWYRNTSIDERKGERWFCSEREALDAGWRAPYWH
jgi:endonuclease YncB( thermonuclease family)